MKVGIVTSYSKPIGFNYGVLQFCTLSPQFGIDPVLIAITRKTTETELVQKALSLGINVRVINEEFRYDPRAMIGFIAIVKDLNLEILDLQTYKPLMFGLFAKRFITRIKLVSWVHGFSQENLKIKLFGEIEKKIHRFTDHVISVSKGFVNRIENKKIPSEKISIIPNAISLDEFPKDSNSSDIYNQFEINEKNFIIGTMGRLSPEKGHKYLVEAFGVISKEFPEARLMIVGDGPERKNLEELVETLGIGKKTIFTGFRLDGRRFFSIFNLMVLPSVDEGLPYVLIEAMIKKVPIVATSVGEVPMLLGGGSHGYLAEPGDVADLIKGIKNTMGNYSKKDKAVIEAFDFVVEHFSPEQRTKSIIDVYQKVVNK